MGLFSFIKDLNKFWAMTRTEANKRLMSSYGNKKQVHHSF